MDGSRFDAWTRRRFGLAAGGFAASLLELAGGEETEAKRKKKRCKTLSQSCKPKGKKKRCCKRLDCQPSSVGEPRCCGKAGRSCVNGLDCCSTLCPGGACFCKAVGQSCGTNRHCCSNVCNISTFKCA